MALKRDPEKDRAWRRRSKPLQRSGLPRKYRPSRGAKTGAQIRARQEFQEAAREQRVCAVCGRADSFDAHHVIRAEWLRTNRKPVYVRLNALRLCDRFSRNRCHPNHESGARRVRLKELTDENIEYAFTLMGAAAYDYLRRHYDGNDPRVTELLEAYE